MSVPTGQLPSRVLGQQAFDAVAVEPVTAETLRGPRSVASNGTHFAVADSSNNRVLVWNAWPSRIAEPAAAVLGQRDFSLRAENDENGDGMGVELTPTARTLNGPQAVAFHGNTLFVLDSDNYRLLTYVPD